MQTRIRGWRALATALIAVVALSAIAVAPAAAITDGSLDGTGHPYVGLMTAHAADGDYLWRCSGTLISPTVFVTAGHCTEAPAVTARIYFDTGPIIPDPAFTLETRNCVAPAIAGYPCGGGVVGTDISTHPQYNPDAFFLFDLGVVILDTPVVLSEYGELPELDALEGLKPSGKTGFTSVGYGLQAAFPDAAAWKDVGVRVRMVANPHLVQINTGFVGDFAILLSNNAHTGGTCFGDSGGPNFIGDTNVLAGVTSFGLNPTCGGTGGVYRLDRTDDLTWLATFFD
jgi:hypothetical protein